MADDLKSPYQYPFDAPAEDAVAMADGSDPADPPESLHRMPKVIPSAGHPSRFPRSMPCRGSAAIRSAASTRSITGCQPSTT
ncbi:MAG: hypothetical protein Ct9H300mP16_05100 [Pseudomonadota bacterium]|nr:MAG: hypothetical protein Ct9H300mP16_05100 [Pseudomonadota bacterium]